jgi:hypothetical protein
MAGRRPGGGHYPKVVPLAQALAAIFYTDVLFVQIRQWAN